MIIKLPYRIREQVYSVVGIQEDQTVTNTLAVTAGKYEAHITNLFPLLKTGKRPIIMDIGANIGLISIAFAHYFPNAIIHALEPIPELYNLLESNVINNHLKQVILTYNSAVSFKNQKLSMTYDSASAGGAHVGKSKLSVPALTLDSFIKDRSIKVIDILKIDIEGYEYKVLEHSQEVVKNKVKYMLIELNTSALRNSSDCSGDAFVKLLKSIFRKVFLIHRISAELWEVSSYDDLIKIPAIFNASPTEIVQDLICFS